MARVKNASREGASKGAVSAPVVSCVGLISKRTQASVGEVVRRFEESLAARGVKVLLDKECARHAGRAGEALPRRSMVGKVDLAICLGGDGTFLSVARRFAPAGTPIMGVNLGRLGFLTEVESAEFEVFFDRYLAGECVVMERMMLEADVPGDDSRAPISVLNDVVITKSALSRMLEFEVRIDGVVVSSYRADGLIVATPTGSTAYSLAAAGPIIVPDMRAVVINPICPHALSQRPIVVPDDSRISITLREGHGNVFLSLDGQVGFPLADDAEVCVRRSPHVARLVRDPSVTFYELLRLKLGWGEGQRGGRFS